MASAVVMFCKQRGGLMSDPKEPSPEQAPKLSEDISDEAARKKTLSRLGLFAAYTAPTALSMIYSKKVAAAAVDSTATL